MVAVTLSNTSAALLHSLAHRRSTGASAFATSSEAPRAPFLMRTNVVCGTFAATASERSLPGHARSARTTALVTSSRDMHHGGVVLSRLSRTWRAACASTHGQTSVTRRRAPAPRLEHGTGLECKRSRRVAERRVRARVAGGNGIQALIRVLDVRIDQHYAANDSQVRVSIETYNQPTERGPKR